MCLCSANLDLAHVLSRIGQEGQVENHGIGTSGVHSGRVDVQAVVSGALQFDRKFRSLCAPKDTSRISEASLD